MPFGILMLLLLTEFTGTIIGIVVENTGWNGGFIM